VQDTGVKVFIYSQLLKRYKPFESPLVYSFNFVLVKISATKYKVNIVINVGR